MVMMNILSSFRSKAPRARRSTSVGVAACAGVMAACLLTGGAQSASAGAITLGTAANYGVVTGVGGTFVIGGGLKVTGNIGLASGYNVQVSGSNSESGTTYYDYTTGQGAYGGSGTFTQGGSVNQSMTQVMSDAVTATNAAAAATATAGLVDQGKSISGSVTIKALQNASENVLNISALSLTNGTLTFDDNGYTNAKFIINVTGNFSLGAGAVIKGINGASADDIIFNIENTGTAVNLTGNSSTSLIGTILAPQRNVTLGGGGSLTGALIAGVNNAGKSYTVTEASSGYNITGLGYTPRTVTNTPEPSSVAIFGAGIAVLVGLKRRPRPSRQS
jgi:choice-of-anchor A domain-containing protein